MHSLERELDSLWPPEKWLGTRLLVAVSGGADSVALLRAIVNQARTQPAAIGQQIQVAHYNHGWRGAESDADEAFVSDLCQRLSVPLVVGRNGHFVGRSGHCVVTTQAARTLPLTTDSPAPVKTEESARDLRYNFLTQAAYQCAARYVLTAHTASDRVETLLNNLFRGTGLAGIVGPPLTRPLGAELVLVRPLLGCWREQVEAYLQELGQDFRQDASNADIAFQRNYLRHKLLPELRERFGEKLDQRLLAFSELAEEVVTDQRELATEYLSRVALLRGSALAGLDVSSAPSRDELYVPSLQKLACSWSVVHQALVRKWQERGWPLQSMSRAQWSNLRRLMTSAAAGDRENLPGNLEAQRLDEWVVIASVKSPRQQGNNKR